MRFFIPIIYLGYLCFLDIILETIYSMTKAKQVYINPSLIYPYNFLPGSQMPVQRPIIVEILVHPLDHGATMQGALPPAGNTVPSPSVVREQEYKHQDCFKKRVFCFNYINERDNKKKCFRPNPGVLVLHLEGQ